MMVSSLFRAVCKSEGMSITPPTVERVIYCILVTLTLSEDLLIEGGRCGFNKRVPAFSGHFSRYGISVMQSPYLQAFDLILIDSKIPDTRKHETLSSRLRVSESVQSYPGSNPNRDGLHLRRQPGTYSLKSPPIPSNPLKS